MFLKSPAAHFHWNIGFEVTAGSHGWAAGNQRVFWLACAQAAVAARRARAISRRAFSVRSRPWIRGRICASCSTVLRYSEMTFSSCAFGTDLGGMLRKQSPARNSSASTLERSFAVRGAEGFGVGDRRAKPARRLSLAMRRLSVGTLDIRPPSWHVRADQSWPVRADQSWPWA